MTEPTRKTRAFLIAGSLLVLGLAAVAAAPAASAHSCKADDPASACGDCESGTHYHSYTEGGIYCQSTGPDPTPSDDCRILGIEFPKIICEGPLGDLADFSTPIETPIDL